MTRTEYPPVSTNVRRAVRLATTQQNGPQTAAVDLSEPRQPDQLTARSLIGRLLNRKGAGRETATDAVDDSGRADGREPTRRQWLARAAGVAVGGIVADAALHTDSADAQTSNFVDTVSNQTIGGVKTFTSAPVVPAGSFPQTAVASLGADLAAKAPFAGPFAPSSPGASAPTRYVGGTTSGAPTTGTFATGDFVIDQSGKLWICSVAGTPGAWAQQSGAGVDLTTAQTIGGVKTFTSAPVVPANSFPQSAVGGLTDALAGKEPAIPAGTYLRRANPNVVQALVDGPNLTFDTLTPPATNYSGPPRVIEFKGGTGGTGAMPFLLGAYFAPEGAFATGTSVLISNKRLNVDGWIQGVSAKADGSEPSMLAVSPDVNGPSVAIEGHGNLVGSNTNATALAVYNMDSPIGGATPYSGGYGAKQWAIDGRGKMYWGQNLGLSPAANATASLDGSTGRFVFTGDVTIPAAGSTVAANYHQSHNRSGPYLQLDGSTATFYARTANLPLLRLIPVAGMTQDIFAVLNPAQAILSRFNKSGYFMTRKTSPPADSDLAASELTIWLDDTNGAPKVMFKAKQNDGGIKTASITLL